ncbi:cytochrome P450 [Mariannaea sp. PMI_226]|nr:cytochrome P450 [Mariannaea sp. PMI_226]
MSAFASMLASSTYGGIIVPPQLCIFLEAITTSNLWAILLALLVTCVVFVVIASTRDMARKVLNSPMYVKPCVIDVFLDGKAHVDVRKGLNSLFTRKALECYLPGQEEVYKTYFQKFLDVTKENNGKPVPFMPEFRELMCAVSCRTFVGYYISDAAVKKIADDYYRITADLELVNFPIIIPYTKTWYGKKVADMTLAEFAKCAAKSKTRMSERWRQAEEKGEKLKNSKKPSPLLRLFSDYELSQTVFTFLYASQDATSLRSELMYWIAFLECLKYTRAVVRELLRYRPPLLMVPYLIKKPFLITDTYTVPKGSMVISTTFMALHDPEVYESPDYFDPERYYNGVEVCRMIVQSTRVDDSSVWRSCTGDRL